MSLPVLRISNVASCAARIKTIRILILLVFPLLLGSAPFQEGGPVIDPGAARYVFGKEILFSAAVQSREPIIRASVLVRVAGADPVSLPVESAQAEGGYTLTARWDLAASPVFPFSSLEYWWEVETASLPATVSSSQTLQYEDDRFAWQQMEKGRVVVNWVEGDAGQADDAADLLLLSLGSESADLDTPIPENIRLYIYPRLADLQTGLGKQAHGWEGALSDPASGVILAAAAPGTNGRNALAILLPHETAHLLLGIKWKSVYADLPAWLMEGLAAGYEMAPRPELERMLKEAAGGGGLIPLSALCRSFPSEEDPALLAYAESRAFVAFLRVTYGLTAVRKAIETYAAGVSCNGLFASTGKSLAELESAWLSQLAGGQAGISVPAGVLLAAGSVFLICLLLAGWFLRNRANRIKGEGKSP